jgi:hypothetical protein
MRKGRQKREGWRGERLNQIGREKQKVVENLPTIVITVNHTASLSSSVPTRPTEREKQL